MDNECAWNLKEEEMRSQTELIRVIALGWTNNKGTTSNTGQCRLSPHSSKQHAHRVFPKILGRNRSTILPQRCRGLGFSA